MAAPDAIHETLAASQRHLLETFKKIALFRHFRLPKDKHVIIPGAGRGARPAARLGLCTPHRATQGGGAAGKKRSGPSGRPPPSPLSTQSCPVMQKLAGQAFPLAYLRKGFFF